jgi:nitrogen fixation protein NifU and related proteins
LAPGLEDLYRDIILDHYRSPRNRGRLDIPDVATQGANPLCGDEIEVSLIFDGDRVADVRFEGRGCSISQASASMMSEGIKGKSVEEVRELISAFKEMMSGSYEPAEDELGDLEALQGVRKYPVRIKCALLCWNTLLEGIDLFQHAKAKPTKTIA